MVFQRTLIRRPVTVLHFIILLIAKVTIGIGIGLGIAQSYFPYSYPFIFIGILILVPTVYSLTAAESWEEKAFRKR